MFILDETKDDFIDQSHQAKRERLAQTDYRHVSFIEAVLLGRVELNQNQEDDHVQS